MEMLEGQKAGSSASAGQPGLGPMTRRGSLSILGAAALGLASGGKPHPARASALIPVRVLGSGAGWNASEIVIMAEEKGFFRREGLALDIIIMPAEQLTIALDAGVTDFIPNAAYIYFLNIKDRGMRARQIVSTIPYLDPQLPNGALFVREDSKIRSAADLRGKTIGMTVLQFASAWYTLAYMQKAGVRRDEVDFIALPAPQHEQVLVRGDVDGVYTNGAVEASLRKKGGFRQLFTTADIPGRRICHGSTIVRDDFIASRPDVVRRYVTAIANAIEWANRNQDEIVHFGISTGRVNAGLAPFLYSPNGNRDYSFWRWPEQGLQNRDDVEFWMNTAEQIKIMKKGKFTAADIYTDQFNPFA